MLALAVTGCAGRVNAVAPPASASTRPGSGPAVQVRTTPLGRVLVDARGYTLYLLTADSPGHRSCAGPCLYVWPPVMVNGTPAAGPGVSARLGTLAVSGGRQLTVDGYPAYTYGADTSPGQTNGQGVATYGGVWWTLRPDGAPLSGSHGTAGPLAPSGSSPAGSGTALGK